MDDHFLMSYYDKEVRWFFLKKWNYNTLYFFLVSGVEILPTKVASIRRGLRFYCLFAFIAELTLFSECLFVCYVGGVLSS